jgi:hypothetical protein
VSRALPTPLLLDVLQRSFPKNVTEVTLYPTTMIMLAEQEHLSVYLRAALVNMAAYGGHEGRPDVRNCSIFELMLFGDQNLPSVYPKRLSVWQSSKKMECLHRSPRAVEPG